MKNYKLVILALSAIFSAFEMYSSDFKERLDSMLASKYSQDAPGCAILIAQEGKIIYEGMIGIADLSAKRRIDGQTEFNIASITKQFTAIGILKCQELGLLNIEDCIQKYIPEFKDDIWKKVKIRHLMSHSSGIPDNRPRTDKNFMLYISDDECLGYMYNLSQLKFEPGSNYDYINPTFQILREIIQRVSGRKFDDFQKEYLFNPAGMYKTFYFEPQIVTPNISHAYIPIKNISRSSSDSDSKKDIGELESTYSDSMGVSWAEYDYGEETFFGTKADGGIYTNIYDFLKWELALARGVILSNTLLNEAYKSHTQVTGSRFCDYQNRDYTHYGYGWFIDSKPNRPLKIYHTGDNGGYQAYAAKYPTCGLNVIMFENRNDIDRWSTQMEIEQLLIEFGYIHE